MKNQSVPLMLSSLAAACLLVACPPPAAAYIKVEPLTLGNLCAQSGHIYVLRVEEVDAERGVILFKSAEQLKGKPDGTTKVQRVRASLKLLDYDRKRDFVGWGAEEN